MFPFSSPHSKGKSPPFRWLESTSAIDNASLVSSILVSKGYRLGPRIGKGSYAKVKVAERMKDGYIMAAKIISRHKCAKEFLQRFLPREISILLSVKHPSIVQIFEVIQVQDFVCLIVEFAEKGDLLSYIKQRVYLDEKEAKDIFYQIAHAVGYLHAKSICHRDLKCENILIRRDQSVALADFGFSKSVSQDDLLSQTYCGSAAYASPELLRGKPYNPFISDIWSLGCLLFVTLSGQMPFYEKNTKKMMCRQLQGRVVYPDHCSISALCKDLVNLTLEPNIDRRADIQTILSHPWLREHRILHRSLQTKETDISSNVLGDGSSSVSKPIGNLVPKTDTLNMEGWRPKENQVAAHVEMGMIPNGRNDSGLLTNTKTNKFSDLPPYVQPNVFSHTTSAQITSGRNVVCQKRKADDTQEIVNEIDCTFEKMTKPNPKSSLQGEISHSIVNGKPTIPAPKTTGILDVTGLPTDRKIPGKIKRDEFVKVDQAGPSERKANHIKEKNMTATPKRTIDAIFKKNIEDILRIPPNCKSPSKRNEGESGKLSSMMRQDSSPVKTNLNDKVCTGHKEIHDFSQSESKTLTSNRKDVIIPPNANYLVPSHLPQGAPRLALSDSISSEHYHTRQEGLVTQMRRIFESRNTGTNTHMSN